MNSLRPTISRHVKAVMARRFASTYKPKSVDFTVRDIVASMANPSVLQFDLWIFCISKWSHFWYFAMQFLPNLHRIGRGRHRTLKRIGSQIHPPTLSLSSWAQPSPCSLLPESTPWPDTRMLLLTHPNATPNCRLGEMRNTAQHCRRLLVGMHMERRA